MKFEHMLERGRWVGVWTTAGVHFDGLIEQFNRDGLLLRRPKQTPVLVLIEVRHIVAATWDDEGPLDAAQQPVPAGYPGNPLLYASDVGQRADDATDA